jgi:hypothetical protein
MSPRTQPALADTKLTEFGAKPAGTAPAGAVVGLCDGALVGAALVVGVADGAGLGDSVGVDGEQAASARQAAATIAVANRGGLGGVVITAGTARLVTGLQRPGCVTPVAKPSYRYQRMITSRFVRRMSVFALCHQGNRLAVTNICSLQYVA